MRPAFLAFAVAIGAAAPAAGAADDAPSPPTAPVPAPPAARPANPLAGDLPFIEGIAAGRKEAAFHGRPLLVFYCLAGDGTSRAVADAAFRDAEVAARAAPFVPVLVDAEADEAFGLEHGVKTIPTILLLDPGGKEAARVAGPAGPAEVLEAVRTALRRIGSIPLTKAGREIASAAAELAEARAKGEWRRALKAVAALEKVGHEGPELEAARAAARDADAESKKRLDAAKALIKDRKQDEARPLLRKVVREFEGLEAAVEAKNLLLELDGPPPDDDDGGGGDDGGGTKGKKGHPGHDGQPPGKKGHGRRRGH